MQKYETKEFNIPELKGISEKALEEHLKLYSGYVKHTNMLLEEIPKTKDQFVLTEMQRRFSFEFDGMRNHEVYFQSFVDGGAEKGGEKTISSDSTLKNAIEAEWGSFEKWLELFKSIAKTRGVGWVMLYYDKEVGKLLNGWVDEQHLGHLNGLTPIIALDMWEHSFVGDYWPSEKGQYIDDFFENVNWRYFEDRYQEAVK